MGARILSAVAVGMILVGAKSAPFTAGETAIYCAEQKKREVINDESYALFGSMPRDGFAIGETITIFERSVKVFSYPMTEYFDLVKKHRDRITFEIVPKTVPVGTDLVVLDRVHESDGFMVHYMVPWDGRNRYLWSAHVKGYESPEHIAAWKEKRSAWENVNYGPLDIAFTERTGLKWSEFADFNYFVNMPPSCAGL